MYVCMYVYVYVYVYIYIYIYVYGPLASGLVLFPSLPPTPSPPYNFSSVLFFILPLPPSHFRSVTARFSTFGTACHPSLTFSVGTADRHFPQRTHQWRDPYDRSAALMCALHANVLVL